jgi:hypothetical protein
MLGDMDEVSSRGSRGEMVLANTMDKCKATICCQPLAPLIDWQARLGVDDFDHVFYKPVMCSIFLVMEHNTLGLPGLVWVNALPACTGKNGTSGARFGAHPPLILYGSISCTPLELDHQIRPN